MDNKEIVKITLQFIDENGVDAVSFRKISKATGVAAMTICNRFGSKDELMRAVLEEMLSEHPLETPEHETWDESLRRIAYHNRELALAHPKAFPLFLMTPPFVSPVREYTETVFASHKNQNLPEDMPFVFLSLMHSYLTGFQLAEQYSNDASEEAKDDVEARMFFKMFDAEAFDRNLEIILKGIAVTYGLELS